MSGQKNFASRCNLYPMKCVTFLPTKLDDPSKNKTMSFDGGRVESKGMKNCMRFFMPLNIQKACMFFKEDMGFKTTVFKLVLV